MKTEARLQELLDNKDAQISELESELDKYHEAEEREEWRWTFHREVTNDEGLPVPRLEMRFVQESDNWFNYICRYDLIYKHMLGHFVAVPMGHTKIGGSRNAPPIFGENINLPFRDGVHIAEDSVSLNLPAFALCNGRIETVTMRDGKIRQEAFQGAESTHGSPHGQKVTPKSSGASSVEKKGEAV